MDGVVGGGVGWMVDGRCCSGVLVSVLVFGLVVEFRQVVRFHQATFVK